MFNEASASEFAGRLIEEANICRKLNRRDDR